MFFVHVEDNGITRASLAHLLGVKNGRIKGHAYISTAIAAAAEERLSEGSVRALVLDIGLNVKWDNQNMHRALRSLMLFSEQHDPEGAEGVIAYHLAVLARGHRVPCALLTNWPDYLKEEDGFSKSALRDTFHADAVFRKDEAGMSECAAWVQQQLA